MNPLFESLMADGPLAREKELKEYRSRGKPLTKISTHLSMVFLDLNLKSFSSCMKTHNFVNTAAALPYTKRFLGSFALKVTCCRNCSKPRRASIMYGGCDIFPFDTFFGIFLQQSIQDYG